MKGPAHLVQPAWLALCLFQQKGSGTVCKGSVWMTGTKDGSGNPMIFAHLSEQIFANIEFSPYSNST